MLTGLATAAALIATMAIASALLFHFVMVKKRLRAMFLLMIACWPLVLVLEPAIANLSLDAMISPRLQSAISAGLAFGFAWFILMHFNVAAEASITPRILSQFVKSKDGSLGRAELDALYPFQEVIDLKIKQMLDERMLVETREGGKRAFQAVGFGKYMGTFFSFVKNFMQWGIGG